MKKERQKKIIELIEKIVIDTQDDLQSMLCSSGFDVTQATVSRDIKEMRIVKMLDSNGVYRYAINKDNSKDKLNIKFVEIFKNSVVSIESAMNDIVIKCHPGMASGACAALDNMYSEYFLGTLAGDDTIFAITRNEADAKKLCNILKQIID